MKEQQGEERLSRLQNEISTDRREMGGGECVRSCLPLPFPFFFSKIMDRYWRRRVPFSSISDLCFKLADNRKYHKYRENINSSHFTSCINTLSDIIASATMPWIRFLFHPIWLYTFYATFYVVKWFILSWKMFFLRKSCFIPFQSRPKRPCPEKKVGSQHCA